MTNTSDSDPNFNIPFTPSNVILPSYNQNPRKKRTKISNNETGSSSSSRPKPVKKPDPNAPKITRPCTECGKQFWSWKALFGHMRCHPERQWRGINPPPNLQRRTTTTTTATSSSSSWVSVTTEEEHNVAACLLMLANGSTTGPSGGLEGRWFECGGCKKVFGSHQALGRHRSTHTHVDQDKRKSVTTFNHRCNICFRVFSSGQALGGHMRCHWERDQEEKQDSSVAIDLNIPAAAKTVQNLSSSSSNTLSGCSLDLRLGL